MCLLQESEFLQWLFNRISNHTSCVLRHSASLRACSERALSWVKHMKHPESLVFFAGWRGHGGDLRFSAALRLPKSIRQREKDEKIERLIQELGLSKVADSRVNKPNTHSSDWLHVQSTPANNYLLLFVHEMISNNQKELYCQLTHTSQL